MDQHIDDGSRSPADHRLKVDLATGNGTNGHRRSVALQVPLSRYLGRRVWWMLVAAVITCALAAVWFALNPVPFRSTVVLHYSSPRQERAEPTTLPQVPTHGAWLAEQARSTAMTDHLIGAFDLYAHYGIDRSSGLYHEAATALLQRNISPVLGDGDILSITVSDRDRSTAAAMANTIYTRLWAMAEEEVAGTLRREIAIHREVIERTQARFDSTARTIAALMDGREPASERHAAVRDDLRGLVMQLSVANDGLKDALMRQEIIATAAGDEKAPQVTLIRKAQEDAFTRPVVTMIWNLVFTFFGTLAALVLGMTLWYKHGGEFTEYFTLPDGQGG